MPIYEYSCAKCGRTIEIIQKMSDKPLKTHAGCGGKLTKLISAAGFQFKGTGWYVTDYANRPKEDNSEAAKEAKPDATPAAEAASKADSSKSAEKTASSDKSDKAHKTSKPVGKTKKS